MKHKLLNILVCPTCKCNLDLESKEESSNHIKTGFLNCTKKGCRYPIINYVPRFVDRDKYSGSFSKQRLYVRRHFKYYEKDRSGYKLFLPTTGFKTDDIKKGILLEIGCGYGRYLDVVGSMGGEIVGVELSTHSIELAQDFVGHNENVHLVQCDLFSLPFREGYFDQIFSIGVLHHTPDTHDAFRAIVPYLKQNGEISIWVYPPEMQKSLDRWRGFTTKLPYSVLYRLCIINQVMFSWIRSLPGGWRFSRIVPGYQPKKESPFWLRVMGDFDGLSPVFAHSHTPEEVVKWFVESGLKHTEILPRRTSIKGRRS
ncbi:MAG: methyltransferase domain-containing protein [Planctomycetota bacterium]